MNLAATYVQLGYGPASWGNAGFRFPNVTVPPTATILEAYIRFESDNTAGGTDCKLVIRGQLALNPGVFTTGTEYESRTRTSQEVLWPDPADVSSLPQWNVGVLYDTYDLKTIVQEIIDQDGWVSGNAMVIFIEDAGSDPAAERRPVAWDHAPTPPANPPTLYITYRAAESTFGRAATCLDEVFVANKHNVSNISDVYREDNSLGSFSANLVGGYPYNLFPGAAPLSNNDAIYFGTSNALFDSGPFCSLVFDISAIATYTVDATMVWEYYTGAAWATLTVRDNTDIVNGFDRPFTRAGVLSVHWNQPSNWAEYDLSGEPGGPAITAYWVRCRVVLGGGAITTMPGQQNRDVYTITWPYVDIDGAQVPGEMEALARIRVHNESDQALTNNPQLWANRVMVGLRSLSRGSDFSAYINISDEQNPSMITIMGAIAADPEAPTGRSYQWNAVAAMADRVHILINPSDHFYGKFKVFLRGRQSGGSAGDIEVRILQESPSSAVRSTSQTLAFANTNAWQVLEFGDITIIPAIGAMSLADASQEHIVIQASNTNIAATLYLYDLILLPVDEWAGEFIDIDNDLNSILGRSGTYPGNSRILDIDSCIFPKRKIRSLVRYDDYPSIQNDAVATFYKPRTNGPSILQHNADQRLWFLSTRFASAGSSDIRCEPAIAHTIQTYCIARYFSGRGSG
jgi:hypothetical protein